MNSNLPKFTSKNRFIILLSCVVILLSILFIYQSFFFKSGPVVVFESFSQSTTDQNVKTVVVKVNKEYGDVSAYDLLLNYDNKSYQLVSAEPGQKFSDGLKIIWNIEGSHFVAARNPQTINQSSDSNDLVKLSFKILDQTKELKLSLDQNKSLIYAKNKGVIYP